MTYSIDYYNYKKEVMQGVAFECDALKDELELAYIMDKDQEEIDAKLDKYLLKLCELNDYKRTLAKMRRGEAI